MAPFSKPEAVLKQAEGLISVGQSNAALSSLTEMFGSKRFRATPITQLEPIVLRFVELCVDLRKGRSAKEGLMQFKNISQNTNVPAIENVILRFVQLADAKVKEAQEKAKAAQVAVDVDDLEASETPESILLGAVSGDQSKDRTDRALVTPWLKFLWETYRTSLETLKNNARLETIYQQIAQQAFQFCLAHERKVEFRRLCETLRLHLANVAKYSHQHHSINLSDPDTLQHHLDTRFAQLNTSVELELWQEAFRSVEDVHNLLTMAKKAPRPAMMANYYEKLTKIFLMSGNALYHAAAWGRYYAIVTSIGGKSEEELSKLAGQVLISALAVPVGLQDEDATDDRKGSGGGKNARLTSLLGLTKKPTRGSLLRDALSRDVLRLSPASVRTLYDILEVTFDPLSLCANISPLLLQLSEDKETDPSYASYLPLLHQAVLSRLLAHLSQVYSSVKITNLHSLVAPLRENGVPGAYDEAQIESYVMGCARRGELNVKIDHLDGCIIFIDEPFASTSGSTEDPFSPSSSYGVGEPGPSSSSNVQNSLADLVRTRLGRVAQVLHTFSTTIDPPPQLSEEEQKEKLTTLVAAAESERSSLLIKRAIVARRRELISEMSARREREASSRKAEMQRREKEEESKRKALEQRQKELERNLREREDIRASEAKKYAQTLATQGVLKPEEVEKYGSGQYDTEQLISMQVQHLEKEKKDTSQKLRTVAKRIDHLERAYRKEERPLVGQDYEQQQMFDREAHMLAQQTLKEESKRIHLEDLETKKRLARMTEEYERRKEVLMAKKGEAYAKRKEAATRKIAEEKEKRRNAVLAERAEAQRIREEEERIMREEEERIRREEEEREAEEERIRAEEEAVLAAEEEAKREAEEKAAAARKAREEERAKAMEQARLQRQREEEAEANRAARKAAERKAAERGAASTTAPASRLNGEGGAAWRRSTPPTSSPATPTRAAAAVPAAPSRPESPSPAAGKYRPGALGGAGGGWRARQAAKDGGGSDGSRPASPAPPRPEQLPQEPAKADDDGFQQVASERKVWRPSRGRGRGL